LLPPTLPESEMRSPAQKRTQGYEIACFRPHCNGWLTRFTRGSDKPRFCPVGRQTGSWHPAAFPELPYTLYRQRVSVL